MAVVTRCVRQVHDWISNYLEFGILCLNLKCLPRLTFLFTWVGSQVKCRCGETMCYVCRQPIAANYRHFCQVLAHQFTSSAFFLPYLSLWCPLAYLWAYHYIPKSYADVFMDLFMYQLLGFVKEWVYWRCLMNQFGIKFVEGECVCFIFSWTCLLFGFRCSMRDRAPNRTAPSARNVVSGKRCV